MAGGSLPWLAGIFHGLIASVIAVVLEAVLRIGRRALKSRSLLAVAALSFVLIFFFKVSFVLIILGAAALGAVGHSRFPRQFPAGKKHGGTAVHEGEVFLDLPPIPTSSAVEGSPGRGNLSDSLVVAGVCLGGMARVEQHPSATGLFFSKAALVTFGGAYAVLPFVAQQSGGDARLAGARSK